MSTNVSNDRAFVGNIASFLQNRDDNFNWFDDHTRCLVNTKLTFGEDVKKGETRYLGEFLGSGSDDNIEAFEDDDGSLHIVIPNARERRQPVLQNNGITSRRVSELEAQLAAVTEFLQSQGIELPQS